MPARRRNLPLTQPSVHQENRQLSETPPNNPQPQHVALASSQDGRQCFFFHRCNGLRQEQYRYMTSIQTKRARMVFRGHCLWQMPVPSTLSPRPSVSALRVNMYRLETRRNYVVATAAQVRGRQPAAKFARHVVRWCLGPYTVQ